MAVNYTNSSDPTGLMESFADREFTIERGIVADLAFEGPKAAVDAKFLELIGLGYSPIRQTSVGGDLWRVVAQNVPTDSDGDPAPVEPDDLIKTKWSCPGNMLEKDIWDLPRIKAALAQIRANWPSDLDKGRTAVAVVRKLVDMWVSGETEITIKNVDGDDETFGLTLDAIRTQLTSFGCDSTNRGYIVEMMTSMAQGTTKFPVSQWVARRVMAGPLTSSLRGVRTNVNRMVTSDYLIEVEGMPDNLLDGIVAGYWLKQTPSVDQDGNLLQVTNEWWWAEDYDRFTLLDPIDAP